MLVRFGCNIYTNIIATMGFSLVLLLLPFITIFKSSDGYKPYSSAVLTKTLESNSENITLTRQIREISSSDSAAPEFTWKSSKTPQFITSKMKKEKAEPILTVYPQFLSHPERSGRSRELIMPIEQSSGKRVVYYATLPDIPHYSTHPPTQHHTDFVPAPFPVSNQQRSYDQYNAGKDFITRVQSAIIKFRPSPGGDTNVTSTPSFTIIDAPPSNQLPPHSPVNRIMMYPEIPKPVNSYQYSPYLYPQNNVGYKPYIRDFKLPYSNSYYYNPLAHLNHVPHISQIQYKQQSPYYGDLEKSQLGLNQYQPVAPNIDPFQPAPYPFRHTRFPVDRYPSSSPLSDLEPSKPSTPSRPVPIDAEFHHPPSGTGNLNLNGPNAAPAPASGSGLDDFNDNVGPLSFDNSLDLDNNHINKPSYLRNKFSTINFNNLANKYLDPAGFNYNSPIKIPESPSLNSQFSHVSDWLTSKPLESSSFDLDDFSEAAAAANAAATSGDYHIKGSSIISSDSNNQNRTSSSTSDNKNTIITPYTDSLSNNTEGEERSLDCDPYKCEINSSLRSK